jgi:hypothetical protein
MKKQRKSVNPFSIEESPLSGHREYKNLPYVPQLLEVLRKLKADKVSSVAITKTIAPTKKQAQSLASTVKRRMKVVFPKRVFTVRVVNDVNGDYVCLRFWRIL